MTRCPDTGALRASLDDEAPEARAHASTCTHCRDELAELRATALASDAALALLAPPAAPAGPAPAPDVAAARPPTAGTTTTALAGAGAPADLAAARDRRRQRGMAWQRRAAAVAAVAVMAAGVVGTPAGREAAASFLAAFRSEQIAVVPVDPWSVANAYFSLSELADVEGADLELNLEAAASIAEAERRVGFPVTAPDPGLLPEHFNQQPVEILTLTGRQVRIAFDEDRVAEYLTRHGADRPIPDGLGETTLLVEVPSGVVLTYRGPDWEQLVVGESQQVTADTEGPLALDAVREFLLDLPALPPETVQQLRAIDDWRTTLPLPVPADGPAWRDTTVAGHDAVLLDDALASAIVWQAEGRIRGVGGVAEASVVRRIAEGVAR